jgi:hypothetical protein
MRNSEALRSLCNAIANTFYPDSATINLVLFNEGITPDAEAAPKDPAIFRAAVSLVMGYVEGSRNENGVQTSVNKDAVEKSIRYWCGIYGLDADDVLSEYLRVMDDGSNRW